MTAAAPMMANHVLKFFCTWTKERLQFLAVKAPKEVPILLFVVLALALVLLVLYAYVLANPNV
jgi:hypothetical protein